MPGFKTDKSSGLLTHYIGTIENSFAGTDAQYMDGQVTRLTWETTVDQVLQEDYEGITPESLMRYVTLGDGWDVNEDGVLYHEDDELRAEKGNEPRDFKSSSFMGELIDLITGETDEWTNAEVNDGGEPFEVDLTGVMDYFEAEGFDNPRDPKIWLGLSFEFRGVVIKQRKNEFNRVVPVRLVSTPKG